MRSEPTRDGWCAALLAAGGVLFAASEWTQIDRSSTTTDAATLQSSSASLLASSFVIFCVITAMRWTTRQALRRLLGTRTLLALSPYVVIVASAAVHHDSLRLATLSYPAFVFAVAVVQPSVRAIRVLGSVALWVASFSLLLVVVRPALAFTPVSPYDSKPLVSEGLLAGPFVHSNVLGCVLALGFPVYLGFARRRSYLGIALFWLAVILSVSRSAIFSMLVVSIIAISRRGRRGPFKGSKPLILALVVLVIAVPLLTTSSSAFTGRGGVWQVAAAGFRAQPLLGQGPAFFSTTPLPSPLLFGVPQTIFHAHNFFLELAASGGLLFLLAVVGVLFSAGRNGLASQNTAYASGLFLVALLSLGVLESSFVQFDLEGYDFWGPLIVFLYSIPDRSHTAEGDIPIVSEPSVP